MRQRKLIVGGGVAIVVVVGAAALFAMSNTLGEAAAGDVRSGSAPAAAAHVVMQDDSFAPASVSVAAGSQVEIELRNAGQANHNFTSQALHVSTGSMTPGEVKTVSITVPKGTTPFVCTWHPGMVIDVDGI